MSNETPFTPKQLIELKRVGTISPSPCGAWIAVTVGRLKPNENTYIKDIWRVSLVDDTPPVQLTFGDSNDHSPCFRSDGLLGFLSDRASDDNESGLKEKLRYQVWVLNPYNEQDLRPITEEPLGVSQFKFASRDDLLAITAKGDQTKKSAESQFAGSSIQRYTKMPIRDYSRWLSNRRFDDKHLIVFNSRGDNRRNLTLEADLIHWDTNFDISADGQKLVINVAEEVGDHEYYESLVLFDLPSGQATQLDREAHTHLHAPHFSPKGNLIACEQHHWPTGRIGNHCIQLVDVESKQTKTLVENGDCSLILSGWSTDGLSLLFTGNEKGQKPIFQVNIESGNTTKVTSTKAGGSYRTVKAITDSKLVCIRSSFVEPPEPYLIGTTNEFQLKKLTSFSNPNCAELGKSVSTENISFEATDGVPIQSYFFKPNESQKPIPTIFWIHGGPIYAWCDEWQWNLNPLIAAAQGYASVLINPRGSTGFGQVFVDGISGNTWGEKSYTDILEAAEFYSERAEVDHNNLAVFGCSFGGYMTNWIGANTDRFRCLITQASIFSLSTFFSTTDYPPYWYWLLNKTVHPYDELEECDKYSPHKKVSNWKSPTLIFHGEKDFRVPITESLSLFEALKYHGVDVEMAIFPDEGHGIAKPENTGAWYELIGQFLDKHMQ